MTCTEKHIIQNQNSDFSIIERFILKGVAQPIDSFNWKLEYFTNNYVKKVAEHRDGVFTGCEKNDDYSVLVVFNNPQFSTGILNKVAHLEFPNPVFPDGIENVVIPARTNIEIIKGASSTMGKIESEVVMSYVQGKSGHSPYFNEDTQSWWQFNDETRQWEDTGIGGGGSGGTSDHRQLTAVSRNAENQHPIGAITGLTAKLEAQDNAIGNLQPRLVSGQNIATINGKSLLTGEDIVITGGSIDFEDVAPGEFFGTQTTDPVPVTGITLSPSTFTLNVGAQRTIIPVISPSNASNKSVTWLSSDPSVATVVNGVVTAIKEGTVTITATAADGSGVSGTSSGTIEKVEPGVILVTGVSLSKTSLTLDQGATEQLTATVLPANATNKTLEWVSSNPAVATVVNGLVTAVSGGNATISASATDGSGKSATCALTVKAVSDGLIAHYDLTRYEDGYTGTVEDLSGTGSVFSMADTPEDAVHARHRAGFAGGKFMVNAFYNPRGQGVTVGATIPIVKLPDILNPFDKLVVGIYTHLRRDYSPGAADGVITPNTGSFPRYNGTTVRAPRTGQINTSHIIPNSIDVSGSVGSPTASADLDPEIHIDHFNGETTITDKYVALIVGFSGSKYAVYGDGKLLVETATGRANLNFSGSEVDFFVSFGAGLAGDIKCIKIWNKDLTQTVAEQFYQEMVEKYG